ncbi:cytochrome c biogenesis protein [Aquibacillus sp. 3ASR75-11]|uniref:Cytochrome c biogenesis protein n=1 Tax=Terrihalobacillus insolitus TaxID=2950438 RepID=A0A9X4AMW5_9BACI|nr:cytochrome c biogenesis protein CcsA [Terrihalobacillus insolitus]MDC3412489.1 cytochrome c biogenesis protein [Terrihalobacillus insolitus]MDC3423908.1 cytochrome c biogenesis protein [Terrihalobacillus insolitus]
MVETKWLFEIILMIYGISVMSYFIDFIQHNRKANQIAFWLLSMVWILQTFFLLYQVFVTSNFPVLTLSDSLYVYAWILVTFSLFINRFFRIDFLVFFTNLLGFFVMLLHVMLAANNELTEQGIRLVSEILIAHITLALISYGFLTFSFILSLMYLVQYKLLKEKKGYKWLVRLGDLEKLDYYSFVVILLGVPMLLLSVILGVVWGYTSDAEFYWYDFKTIGSFVVLVVYFIYLFLRVIKRYQGRSISLFNTAAFLFLLVNFFLFESLSKFHF